MRVIYCDAETYSELNLTRVGARRYVDHPSTRVLMWSFYHPGWSEAVVLEDEPDLGECLDFLLHVEGKRRHDEHILLVHWGKFDRLLAEAFAQPESTFDTKPRQRDDMPQAYQYSPFVSMLDLRQLCLQVGGPGKLKHAARWVGSEKLDGLQEIKFFSQPDKDGKRQWGTDHPGRWGNFIEYAKRDAEVLNDICDVLGPVPACSINVEHFKMIERMNERGIPIDKPSVEQAKHVLEEMEPKLVEECKALTGGIRPTQTKRLAEWLETPNTQRETLEELREDYVLPAEMERVIDIRLEVASATRHKLTPMIEQAIYDRVYDQFTYYGAWTRRLTAQGMQPQNFFRGAPTDYFFDERIWYPESGNNFFNDVKRNIRGFIKAPEDRILVAADYSQIELRVMAWLAGEDWLLDGLHDGEDVYRITAGQIFRCSPEEVTSSQRHVGKTVELASMYGIGGGGYYKREGRRAGLSEPECYDAIEVYRASHQEIVGFWRTIESAFEQVIRMGGTATLDNGVMIERTYPDLIRVIRPSGHFQCFWNPRLVPGEYRLEIAYTGRDKSGAMSESRTYGGRLAQGVVQGTAADLMLCGMRAAEVMGYPPIMSIHDEVVCEIEDDGDPEHYRRLEEIFAEQLPTWAEGLPVTAEGWQGKRFRK